MSVKESLLNWLESSAKRQHRASAVEEESKQEGKEGKESELEKKVPSTAERAEVHQDPYHPDQ